MRTLILPFLICFSLLSCKQTTTEDTASEGIQTIEGEFIFLSDAAVLKGKTFIYGVALDDKMQELATIIKPLQRDKFDMVPVIIKGVINPKPAGKEGWDEIVTIKEIIEVKAPKGDTPITIESGDRLKTEGRSIKVESDK